MGDSIRKKSGGLPCEFGKIIALRSARDRNHVYHEGPARAPRHRWRSYRVECAGTLSTSEAKRHRGRLVSCCLLTGILTIASEQVRSLAVEYGSRDTWNTCNGSFRGRALARATPNAARTTSRTAAWRPLASQLTHRGSLHRSGRAEAASQQSSQPATRAHSPSCTHTFVEMQTHTHSPILLTPTGPATTTHTHVPVFAPARAPGQPRGSRQTPCARAGAFSFFLDALRCPREPRRLSAEPC